MQRQNSPSEEIDDTYIDYGMNLTDQRDHIKAKNEALEDELGSVEVPLSQLTGK